MKNQIVVSENNINLFSNYQGNDKKLKIGDVLTIENKNVACVYQKKGYKSTFSIFQGEIIEKYKNEKYQHFNRYALNDKFVK